MKNEKITEKTITEILKRSKGRCEDCGCPTEASPHHIFFKSQYFGKDRNLAWNLAELCNYHHRIMHHASKDNEVIDKNRLDYKLKKEALERYHGKNNNSLAQITKRAFIKTKCK